MSTMTAAADFRATARPLRCGHGTNSEIALRHSGIRLTQRGRLVVVLALFAIMVLFVIAGAFRATAAPRIRRPAGLRAWCSRDRRCGNSPSRARPEATHGS